VPLLLVLPAVAEDLLPAERQSILRPGEAEGVVAPAGVAHAGPEKPAAGMRDVHRVLRVPLLRRGRRGAPCADDDIPQGLGLIDAGGGAERHLTLDRLGLGGADVERLHRSEPELRRAEGLAESLDTDASAQQSVPVRPDRDDGTPVLSGKGYRFSADVHKAHLLGRQREQHVAVAQVMPDGGNAPLRGVADHGPDVVRAADEVDRSDRDEAARPVHLHQGEVLPQLAQGS